MRALKVLSLIGASLSKLHQLSLRHLAADKKMEALIILSIFMMMAIARSKLRRINIFSSRTYINWSQDNSNFSNDRAINYQDKISTNFHPKVDSHDVNHEQNPTNHLAHSG